MRWLIVSNNNPAGLHALLESATLFMPHTPASVVFRATSHASLRGYQLVDQRFRVQWIGTTNFQAELRDALESPDEQGRRQKMLMLTPDTVFWARPVDLLLAWHCLRDTHILGVDFSLGCPASDDPTSPYWPKLRLQRAQPPRRWSWPDCRGRWGRGLDYGCACRPDDLAGPLSRQVWGNLDAFMPAIQGDPALRRKAFMVCLEAPSLLPAPPQEADAAERYLRGEAISVPSLIDNPTTCTWVRL